MPPTPAGYSLILRGTDAQTPPLSVLQHLIVCLIIASFFFLHFIGVGEAGSSSEGVPPANVAGHPPCKFDRTEIFTAGHRIQLLAAEIFTFRRLG